jgi:hypothetical protein
LAEVVVIPEVQGPVPLPELSELLKADKASAGKLLNHYVDFVKHYSEHLHTFYPCPSKATLNLYGQLIVEQYPEFEDRIRISRNKTVVPWV